MIIKSLGTRLMIMLEIWKLEHFHFCYGSTEERNSKWKHE
jgi:hypothetical protein